MKEADVLINAALRKGEKTVMKYSPEEVAKAAGGKMLVNGQMPVTGISTDTRTIRKGDAFLALMGPNFDGHVFVGEAVSKGAAALILERGVLRGESDPKFDADGSVSVIAVKDTLKALGEMAHSHRKAHAKTKVVAITGSAGKTTTKDMAAAVLSVKYKVLKNNGTLNNLVGVPSTLLGLEDEDVVILELGTSSPGEIEALSRMVDADVAVVTNVGAAHLEGLGSIEGVAKEKSALPKSLRPDSIFVVNLSAPHVVKMARQTKAKLIGFASKEADSIDADETLRLMEVREDHNALHIALASSKGEIGVRVPALGYHNAVNALAAAAIGRAFNMSLKQIKQGLESAQLPTGRGNIITTLSGTTIIDDSYNSNPLSTTASLRVLRSIKRDGKSIAVLGDMLELGKAAKEEHKKIGEEAAKLDVDELVCVGQFAKEIAGGYKKRTGRVANVAKNAIEAAKVAAEIAGPRDVILVKASRLMALEETVGELKRRLKPAN